MYKLILKAHVQTIMHVSNGNNSSQDNEMCLHDMLTMHF